MTFVGLDPDRAGEIARHLDGAAAELEAHANQIAGLLAEAGISSSHAPATLREIAGWAAYRSRDLRSRIDKALAADRGDGPRRPGFRFASNSGAKRAGDEAADQLVDLIGETDKARLQDNVRQIAPYLVDARFAAEVFKRLGPKRTFDLLTALKGSAELLVVARALAAASAAGAIGDRFLDGILHAAHKRAAALDAYVHPWGAVDERDRAAVALDEYVHRAGSPSGTYKLLESTAPLVPYLESGTRVAIIGGAIVIVATAGACVLLSEGTCLGPAAAMVEQGAVVFSSEDPSLPTGLFETLPLSLEDEATFTRFIDTFRTALPRAQVAFRGSSATGVKWETGQRFDATSDIDLAVVDPDLLEKAQELGLKLWGGGTRTAPLMPLEVQDLGLEDLAAELSEIANHPVSFMIYRSMDDILARGPAIMVPGP